MRAGDIVFVRGNTLISRLIRFFDKGEFTHVAIAVSDTHVVEAQRFTPVRIAPMMTFEDYELVSLDLTEEQRDKLIKLAFQATGQLYDYVQAFSYVFRRFLRTGVWNNPNAVICSELVAKLLADVGYLEPSAEIFDYTPNELWEVLTCRKGAT
jgi:hypothetical protein